MLVTWAHLAAENVLIYAFIGLCIMSLDNDHFPENIFLLESSF